MSNESNIPTYLKKTSSTLAREAETSRLREVLGRENNPSPLRFKTPPRSVSPCVKEHREEPSAKAEKPPMVFSSTYRPAPQPSHAVKTTSISPAPTSHVSSTIFRGTRSKSGAPKSKSVHQSPAPLRFEKSSSVPPRKGKTDVPVEIFVPKKTNESSSEEDTPEKRRGGIVLHPISRSEEAERSLPAPPPRRNSSPLETSLPTSEVKPSPQRGEDRRPSKTPPREPQEGSETTKSSDIFTMPRFSPRTPSVILDSFASSTPKRSADEHSEFITPLPVKRQTVTPTMSEVGAQKSSTSPIPNPDNVLQSMSASAEKRCCRRPSPTPYEVVHTASSQKRCRTTSASVDQNVEKRACGCARSRSLPASSPKREPEDTSVVNESNFSPSPIPDTSALPQRDISPAVERNGTTSCGDQGRPNSRKVCTPSPSLTPSHVIASVEVNASGVKREAPSREPTAPSTSPIPTEEEIARSLLSSAEKKRCGRPTRETESEEPLIGSVTPTPSETQRETSPHPSAEHLLDSLRNSAKRQRQPSVKRTTVTPPQISAAVAPEAETHKGEHSVSQTAPSAPKEETTVEFSIPPALGAFSPSPDKHCESKYVTKVGDRSNAQEREEKSVVKAEEGGEAEFSPVPEAVAPLPAKEPLSAPRSAAVERSSFSAKAVFSVSPSISQPVEDTVKMNQMDPNRSKAVEREGHVCRDGPNPNGSPVVTDRDIDLSLAVITSEQGSTRSKPLSREAEKKESVHDAVRDSQSEESSKVFYDCVSAAETPALPVLPQQFLELEKMRDSAPPTKPTAPRASAVIAEDEKPFTGEAIQHPHVPLKEKVSAATSPLKDPLPRPVPLSSQVRSSPGDYVSSSQTLPESEHRLSEVMVSQTPSGKQSGRRSQLEELLDMLPDDVAEDVRRSEQQRHSATLVEDTPNRLSYQSEASSISERVQRPRQTYFDASAYSKYLDEMNKETWGALSKKKKKSKAKRKREAPVSVENKAQPFAKKKKPEPPVDRKKTSTAKSSKKSSSSHSTPSLKAMPSKRAMQPHQTKSKKEGLVTSEVSKEIESVLFSERKKANAKKSTRLTGRKTMAKRKSRKVLCKFRHKKL